MTLQLYARPGRGGSWPKRLVRRLTTLCAMAAAAERGLHAGARRARAEAAAPTAEASAAVRDATFLNAILPYALSQAGRHREPLTVFCIELDRLAALHQSHGPIAADAAVRRLAEAVARALRGSDVVARLDDDRVMVVLPNTGPLDAPKVAEVVRSAAAPACRPGSPPGLSTVARASPPSPRTPSRWPASSPRPTRRSPARPARPAAVAGRGPMERWPMTEGKWQEGRATDGGLSS